MRIGWVGMVICQGVRRTQVAQRHGLRTGGHLGAAAGEVTHCFRRLLSLRSLSKFDQTSQWLAITMRPFSALILSALAAAVNGAALPPADVAPNTDFDAIIVGGGPAGLSALSGLARVRRKVLLIDSGEYRNGVTRHMHDVIGFDGKPLFTVSPSHPN